MFDYGFRIYDPRLCRFLSVDPLTESYPSWSSYPFAMNMPINGVDIDGGEWRLTIFSPVISEKFLTAMKANDLYEQRRLTYWAINNTFQPGANQSWVARSSQNSGADMPSNLPVATLEYDKNAADGVTVITHSNLEIGGHNFIREDAMQSLYKPAINGGNTAYYDKFYPVDIRLKDNMTPKNEWEGTWKDYYKYYSLLGTITGLSGAVGNKPNYIEYFTGHMKGYGHVEFSTSSSQGFGLEASAFVGSVLGYPTSQLSQFEATPLSLTGAGASKSMGASSFGGSSWEAYNNIEDKLVTWQGTSYTVGVGLLPFKFSFSSYRTDTKLLFPVPKDPNAK